MKKSIGSHIGFFVVAIFYLLMELAFKGYAITTLGDPLLLPYEIDALQLIGRSISSFGLAFFAVGFIHSRYRLAIFAGLMAFFFFAQKLAFDHIHIFASDQVTQTAYHTNLFTTNIYNVKELTSLMPFSYEEKDSLAFKSFWGILPVLFAGNETIASFAKLNEKTLISAAENSRYADSMLASYNGKFMFDVVRPLSNSLSAFKPESQESLFKTKYYDIIKMVQICRIDKKIAGHPEYKELQESTLRKLSQLKEGFKQYPLPTIAQIEAVIPRAMKERGYSYAKSCSDIVLKKIGYKDQGLQRFNLNFFSYTDITGAILNIARDHALKSMLLSLPKQIKRPLTKTEIQQLTEIVHSMHQIRDLFFHKQSPSFFKSVAIGNITDPQDLYSIFHGSREDSNFARVIQKYNKPKVPAFSDLTSQDNKEQVKMALVPPIVLFISTFALFLNLFSIFNRILSLVSHKVWLHTGIALSLTLCALLYPLYKTANAAHLRTINPEFIEKTQISTTRLFIATWFTQTNALLYGKIGVAEDLLSGVLQDTVESAIIKRRKENGTYSSFDDMKYRYKRKKNFERFESWKKK